MTKLNGRKFVLSPSDRGIDSYRTWEGLAIDAIPIVIEYTLSKLDKFMFILVVAIGQKLMLKC